MEVEYRRYLKENKARFMAKLMKLGLGRGPSRRRRDESEEILLTYLDAQRWKRLEREGKIAYLGDRKYRISLS